MDSLHIDNLLLFIIFFVPGFISIKVYDLLIAGDRRDFSKSFLEVVAYSSFNLAILSWLIWPALYYRWYDAYPVIFGLLAVLALLIAPIAWPYLFLQLVKQPWLAKIIVAPIRRPWDWVFSKKEEYWVVVTLKDGRKVGGKFSGNSYASSFPLPEQIYLEETWELGDDQAFIKPVPRSKGIIILKDIGTIEFLGD